MSYATEPSHPTYGWHVRDYLGSGNGEVEMSAKIGLEWIGASTVVPATAMILMDHPLVAAVTMGAGFAAAVLIVRIRARAQQAREREWISYASTAASLGTDPAPVIRAFHAEQAHVVEEARGPELHFPRGRW